MFLRAEKDEYSNEYYIYLVVYVEDFLSIHKYPGKMLATVNRDNRLKEPLECPTMYLAADICKYHVNGDLSGTECWAMSADRNGKKALEVVQDRLREDNVKSNGSNKTAEHPFSSQ